MHGKSSEVQSPTKNSKNTQTVKGTQGTKPPEGFILTNTALNTYVYEYLKSPTEETYSLLESINAPLAEEIKYKKPKMNRKNKTVLNSLVGSLIDTVDLSTIEVLDEEKETEEYPISLSTRRASTTAL